MEDDDVLFYWLIVAADFEIDDDEIHKVLLHKICYCLRIFFNKWLARKYKQHTKSLRRDLHDSQ